MQYWMQAGDVESWARPVRMNLYTGSKRTEHFGNLNRKEVTEMRNRTVNVVCAAARWIETLLEVRLPMDVVAGLRTR